MQTKKCSKCSEIKPIEDFYKEIKGKYGVRSKCKICLAEEQREYCKNCPDRKRNTNNNYRKNNAEKVKSNRTKYIKNNIEIIRIQRNKINTKRRKDVMVRVNNIMSEAIRQALKGNKNRYHWEDLVGYKQKNLINHIESRFTSGMSWDNQGKWHIDHIIPISLWQFDTPQDREFKQCWALCNLQPLWSSDNQKKYNKTEYVKNENKKAKVKK